MSLYIIGGTHKKRRLSMPKGDHLRPTLGRVRETVFNICQMFIEGKRFLDCFAGTGAMVIKTPGAGTRLAGL